MQVPQANPGLKLARLVALLLACAGPARAEDLSQTDAQTYATQVNQAGADQSLRRSTTMAMQALIQFGDSDLKGAFTNAYRAYSSFKNSENLDRAHKQALLDKASLASAGTSNLTGQETSFLTSVTSYRRLDPSFLSSGDDAQVAADFEQKTGIKRQDFLDMLANVSENKLYVSDPQLAEKVDAQIDGFLARIPDAGFRAKVGDAFALVPSLERHEMLVEAVRKMVSVAGKFSAPGAGSAAATIAVAEKPSRRGDADRAPAAEAAKETKGGADDPTAFLTRNLTEDEIARSGRDGSGSHKLDGVIQAAIHDDPESETIFEKISRRYRMLTSDLVPAKDPRPVKD